MMEDAMNLCETCGMSIGDDCDCGPRRKIEAEAVTNGDNLVPLRVIVRVDGATVLDLSPEEASDLWQAVRALSDFTDEYRD